MDLIYADALRKDIGVMTAYTLDMAYGSGENDFACTVDRGAHCCDRGFFCMSKVKNMEASSTGSG